MVCQTLFSRLGSAILIGVTLSFFAPVGHAQTGAALLVKPWPDKNQFSDGTGDAFFFASGHTKYANSAFQLYDFESVGRFRILPGNEISPRIGYEFLYLDNHTGNHTPGLASQLSDESIALGTGIAKVDKWLFGITLGVGYAGSSAFTVGSAWYGKADFVVAREINDNDAIGFVLDYDGHRTYLPDVPLPGFGYSHRFDPKLQVVAGVPYSSLNWKPYEHVEIQLEYFLLQDFKASAGYEFIKGFTLYGSYDYIRDAFREEGLGKDRRLLFFEKRAELGLRYHPIDQLTAKIAVGYGWDGTYRSGWDFRNTRLVADFSDEPYLRGGFEWKF